jgi:cytochrome c-type biogenesis protein CcmH/NrfG
VFYFYLFTILFLSVYVVLTDKRNYLTFNVNILTSFFVAILSLGIYENFLSEGSFKLANQKNSLDIFFEGEPQSKNEAREDVEDLVTDLVAKKDAEAGELYILARQLKDVNEFELSKKVYKEIYNRFRDDLDENVIAEYAQVLFLGSDRKFNKQIELLLDEVLEKNQNNPSALTLKGLSELEKNNISLTVELWNRAIPFLNSEKEKNDLKSLIEAVKKGKNQ